MPIVQTQTTRTVSPTSLPGASVTPLPSASFGANTAAQLQALGQTGENFAADQLRQEAARLKAERAAIQEANELRVEEALNQTRQAAQDLAYDEKAGFAAQRGQGALYRSSGKDLTTEYDEKFGESVSKVSAALGTPEQRALYAQKVQPLRLNFRGDVQRHQLAEYTAHSISVYEGATKLHEQAAERNWANPEAVARDIEEAKKARSRANGFKRVSANDNEAELAGMESRVYEGVVSRAIAEGDTKRAMQYLEQKSIRDKMTSSAIVSLNSKIGHDLDAKGAQAAVSVATAQLAPMIDPNEFDRLLGSVNMVESGNRDYNPDGTPVTSTKGALFSGQVMPATAANPGFGIKPAASATPAEYNRVGRELFAAMLKKYPNANLALAAYNAGPGAVDAALEKAKAAGTPNNWMAYVPDETKAYVPKVMAIFQSGGGAPRAPSKMAFVEKAVESLGPNARPSTIKMARDTAEKQYGLMQDELKDKGEFAWQTVQQELIANGGDTTKVSATAMANLARFNPGAYNSVESFAKALPANADIKTDNALYFELTTNAQRLSKLTDAQFNQTRAKLSRPDFEHIQKMREDLLTGKVGMGAGTLNTTVVNDVVKARFKEVGINPPKAKDDKDADNYGARVRAINASLYAQQAQLGRKMTPEETTRAIDDMFAKQVPYVRPFFERFMGAVGTVSPLTMKSPSDVPKEFVDWAQQERAKAKRSPLSPEALLAAYIEANR